MLNWGNSSCCKFLLLLAQNTSGPQADTAALLFEKGWRWLLSRGAAGAFPAALLLWCEVTGKSLCSPISSLPNAAPSLWSHYIFLSLLIYFWEQFNITITLKWSGSTFWCWEISVVSLNYKVGALDSDLTCGKDSHVPCAIRSLKQSWDNLKPQR